jgi:hemoglobin
MQHPDITNREDIFNLVTQFYKKLLADDSISYFFTTVTHLDLEAHLPVLTDFWENILFQKDTYRNNPMAIHMEMNQRSPIKKHHFDTWLRYFSETVNELFEGAVAEKAKERALSIATVMQVKLAAKK